MGIFSVPRQQPTPRSSGFTLVELLVVISVSGIMMTVITGFALRYWGKTISLSNDQQTLVSRLNSGDYLRAGVDSASGLITQNNLPDAHVGKPDPADGTGTHWLIIHAIPTTVVNGGVGTFTPLIYYNRPSIDTSKNIIMNGTIPYEDDVILYMNGTTKQLLARVIANQYAPSNSARTTCPAASATNACPADNVIANDVKNIGMRYFSRSGNTIDYTSIVDPNTGQYIGPDYPSVEIVEFTIQLFHKAQFHNAQDTTNQTVIRVALRN
jgi:prepilin-type N-terminal cleavage/methylation domain-containing protein